ncbi:MAG: rhomboid family intramembrane serine protease [Candidatus Woesearchaeota archaeon]
MKFRNAVIPLITINIVAFILQIVLGSSFTESFMLISSDILVRPWILLTSMFLHGGLAHLFFNMYILFMFGSLLESRIGAKRFLFLYFISGIVAALAASFFYPRALGASGAIYGILGMLIIIVPELKVSPLFLPIAMPLWQVLVLFAFLDFFVFSHIAVAAHLAGAVFGLIYAKIIRKEKKTFNVKFNSNKTHMNERDIEEYLRKGRL